MLISDLLPDLLPNLEAARREIRKIKGPQIRSNSIREHLRTLANDYYGTVRPAIGLVDNEIDLKQADEVFDELLMLSHKNASKDKCLRLLKDARAVCVRLDGIILARGVKATASNRTRADELIIDTLRDICSTAGLAYEQALTDLGTENRLSYRGPATDLREALRETLDTLAPDAEVEAMPGYKPETDAKRPTMKQKVRCILRKRGFGSSQLAASESVVDGVEGIVGGLVRSVYTRSSVSTHTATDRSEVMRIHAWVRLVLCELLEIPN